MGKETPDCECARCRELTSELAAAQQQLAAAQQKIAELSEQLAKAKKNSSTSSKPPSSDIVKPKPPVDESNDGKRKIGGQPGHPKHEREPFPTEQITDFFEHALDACPCCGGGLRRNGELKRVAQQMDVGEAAPLKIEQHTCPEYWCDRCQKPYWASMPLRIQRGGLVGPNLTALIAFMKGFCHASYATTRKFLRDVMGVNIGRSTLAKTIDKVSKALEGTYEELLDLLPSEDELNIDETGHKNNGERWWTWCFRADLYTLYQIDPRRSSEVLIETLGADFNGVIGCDYFSAYRKYMRLTGVELQFCMAHLIRDVKFLTTLSDAKTKAYGERLRLALRDMFGVIHRREEMSAAKFDKELKAARDGVLRAGLDDVPATSHAQNMAKRFREHGESYFTFVTTPGVEPTNNLAEQAIRFVVIDRHITQGTRSEAGRKWSERIWTVIATCSQQGKCLYAFLRRAVNSWFKGEEPPSLLPDAVAA
jgi:transposase